MAKVGRKVKAKAKGDKDKTVSSSFLKNPLFKYFLIIPIVTILVYIKGIGHDYINFDDDWYIYENQFITNFTWDNILKLFSAPHHGQYSPLPQFIYGLLFLIHNSSPVLLKILSIIIHVVNTILVFRLSNLLFKNYNAAIIISGLFALHPVQVESVIWVTAMFKLSATFSLIALINYVKYLNTNKLINYFYIILCFILSFLSKEQAVLLPLSIVVIDIFEKRKLFSRKVIVEKIPLFAMALIFGILTMQIAQTGQDVQEISLKASSKIYMGSLALINYFQKLLIPYNLSFSYIFPLNLGSLSIGIKLSYTILLIVILSSLFLIGRKSKEFIFGLLFYLVNISLAIIFVFFSLRDFYMADRYQYLACFGFFIMLYFLIARFIKNNTLFNSVFIFYLGILTVVTFFRVDVFKNSETLWTDAIKKNPDNFHALTNRGQYYRTQNKYDLAFRDYNKAIGINPKYHLSVSNRGKIYFDRGQYKEAIEDYTTTIKLNRSYVDAWSNRGAAYAMTGNLEKGLEDLNEAIRLDPGNSNSISNRALTYLELGQYEKSIQDFERYMELRGSDADIINSIAICYMNMEEFTKAAQEYTKAIRLKPNTGIFYANRSYCYFMMNNKEKAAKDVEKAKQLGAKIPQQILEFIK